MKMNLRFQYRIWEFFWVCIIPLCLRVWQGLSTMVAWPAAVNPSTDKCKFSYAIYCIMTIKFIFISSLYSSDLPSDVRESPIRLETPLLPRFPQYGSKSKYVWALQCEHICQTTKIWSTSNWCAGYRWMATSLRVWDTCRRAKESSRCVVHQWGEKLLHRWHALTFIKIFLYQTHLPRHWCLITWPPECALHMSIYIVGVNI